MKLIKEDRYQAEQYKQKAEAKISAFQSLLEYCGQYVTIDNRTAFYNAPLNEFRRLFKAKTKKYNELPEYKVYELFGVDLQRIEKLENELKSNDVTINAETLEAEPIDFGIYATTEEEQKLLETAQEWIALAEKSRHIRPLNPALFAESSNGLIYFNGQGFEVNENTIKGVLLRY